MASEAKNALIPCVRVLSHPKNIATKPAKPWKKLRILTATVDTPPAKAESVKLSARGMRRPEPSVESRGSLASAVTPQS